MDKVQKIAFLIVLSILILPTNLLAGEKMCAGNIKSKCKKGDIIKTSNKTYIMELCDFSDPIVVIDGYAICKYRGKPRERR